MQRILCAAIWYCDETTPVHNPANIKNGLVLCDQRHYLIISKYEALTGKRTATVEHVQGFLTSDNKFANRKQAGYIAFKAGQTAECKGQLTSEDLY